MPLFYQQNINETAHLAIWSIQEPASFFETESAIPDIPSELRQHVSQRRTDIFI